MPFIPIKGLINKSLYLGWVLCILNEVKKHFRSAFGVIAWGVLDVAYYIIFSLWLVNFLQVIKICSTVTGSLQTKNTGIVFFIRYLCVNFV